MARAKETFGRRTHLHPPYRCPSNELSSLLTTDGAYAASTTDQGRSSSSSEPTRSFRAWCRPYVQSCAAELATLQVAAADASPAALLGLSRAELGCRSTGGYGTDHREVAAELYVSVKTVEYHLRNSFIKLDISSRRELSALIR